MKTFFLLFFVCLFSNSDLLAQETDIFVEGVVTDAEGMPIPGVSVIEQGTSNGVVTDFDGEFTINVPSEAILEFIYLGYTTMEIAVDGQTQLDISMEPATADLEEVVVVGYGSITRNNLTSAVSSLDSDDFVQGTTSPLMAIQGKVPGLMIQSTNGADPNAGVSIQLRGINSVNASQGPLVVIDGVPGGNINSVVKEDIASIEVLRDASAAAIYGTRASGGVILITTKQAKAGVLTTTYTGEIFTQTVRRYAEPLSKQRFLEEGLGEDLGHNTDWFDEVTNDNPITYRNVVSLSGGTESAQIRASVSNENATGLGIGSEREETKARINTSFELFGGFLEIINNLSYSEVQAKSGSNGAFRMALQLNPTQTPYDPTSPSGYNVWTGGYDLYNPVADIRLRKDERKYRYLLNNTTLILNLTNDLAVTGRYSIKNNNDYGTYWRSAQHKTSLDQGVAGYASQDYSEYQDRTFEAFVNYNEDFGGHTFNLLGGYSFQEFNGEGFSANNSDFPVDGVQEYDLGTGRFLTEGRAGIGSWKNPRVRLMAVFGRLNYSWENKYLLTASVRREGSSKFATGNKWGTFPAVSVGWNITEEAFMENQDLFDNLKLRAGYGETGNEGFAPGVATRMYAPDTWWMINGEWRTTYGLAHNQNTDLRWETKKEYDLGVEFNMIDNKLQGNFSVFQKDIDDLIYDISVAQPPAIHDKTTMNVGTLRSTGWEAELTWNVFNSENFKYSTTLIGSSYESELVTLAGSQTFWDRMYFPAPGSPGNAVRLFPGRPIGQFYVWDFAGFTEEGNWMLYDQEGVAFDVTERTKTNEDKKFSGNAIPDLILAWNHQFYIGNFDISAYFRSWIGHDVFNMTNMYYGIPLDGQGRNVLVENYEEQKDITGEKELSDYFIEDGDFLKLDALSVGYSFNTKEDSYLNNLRLYATGRNLFVLTDYSGIDPEVNINGLDPGFEGYDTYPETRTFMLGVQASF